MLERVKALVPTLSFSGHKGQAGKILVAGGSVKFTGAPYYAGMAALTLGADLVSVICNPDAAGPIKSYSPDLMVQGCLLPKNGDLIREAVKAVDSVVIGCGLGRETDAQAAAQVVVEAARAMNKRIVVDGDALWLINAKPDLIKGYSRAIITPNAMEFRRLWLAIFGSETSPPPFDCGLEADGFIGEVPCDRDSAVQATSELARALGGVTVVRKGSIDIVSDGKYAAVCGTYGAPRRMGGQGDVLAGACGTLYGWVDEKDIEGEGRVVAAIGGCILTRLSARKAYEQERRSMRVPHMLSSLGWAVEQLKPSLAPLSKSYL